MYIHLLRNGAVVEFQDSVEILWRQNIRVTVGIISVVCVL